MADWKNIAANRTDWKKAIRVPSIYNDKKKLTVSLTGQIHRKHHLAEL
jgi:hypothetical protein